MKAVEGPGATVEYFTEHVHIDNHHSRMALERIIRPAVAQYGTWALEEVLRGFEESRAVGDLHTDGLARQLAWMAALQDGSAFEAPGPRHVLHRRTLAAGTSSNFFVAAGERSVCVQRGAMTVEAAFGCERALPEGSMVRIPAGVTFKMRSETGAEYEIASEVAHGPR